MSANSFGHLLRFTSFGESHGTALGAVIEGIPAGMRVDLSVLDDFIQRRRPGLSQATSARGEDDQCEILSGVFDGKTLGTPIAVVVRNKDARSADYEKIKESPRPGHADDVWKGKYSHVDYRGGGRSSGRETVARVISGAFAKMMVTQLSKETQIQAYPKSIGPLQFAEDDLGKSLWSLNNESVSKIEKFLLQAKEEGQSYGGVAQIVVTQPPAYLGQPTLRKLKSDLAMLSMSLGATQGFELAEGFSVSEAEGVDFHSSKKEQYGGIRGGITTGETIRYSVAFKPTSSVLDVAKKGRHDPCVVLRALVVLEAMTWFAIADHLLWRRLDNI